MSKVGDVDRARLESLFGLDEIGEFDVRPLVAHKRAGAPSWVFALCAIFAAVLLFVVLNARRNKSAEPAVRAPVSEMRGSVGLPPLQIPPAPTPQQAAGLFPAATSPPIASHEVPPPAAPAILPQRATPSQSMEGRLILPNAPARSDWNTAPAYVPSQTIAESKSVPAESRLPPPNRASAPILVIDVDAADTIPSVDVPQSTGRKTPPEPFTAQSADPPAQSGQAAAPARLSNIPNHSATIPQGTLIPAILETAFDSTNPGYTRAIVSRNVRGFDGSRILIPRGSRLVGEYKSETSSGQRRALINWTQLTRPDGLVVRLDSPAVDPLGRGGIPAKVTSNGFGRFLGTLLQSTLDIGRTIVAQKVGGTVLLAYPGAISGLTQATTPQAARDQPRLRVDPGTSISVFVARDLVFANPEKAK